MSSVNRTTLLGFLSALLIAATSVTRGWPFPTLTAEPWVFQYAPTNTLIKYAMFVGFVSGVIGICWAWIRSVIHARNDQLSVKRTWFIWVLWALPIALSVPLFSGDVYVYWVDGEAHIRGYSIYETGVAAMGPDPMVHMVHPLWQETRTMYGPLFIRLAEGVAWVANGSVLTGVAILRLIVIASIAVLGIAATSLAKVFNRKPAEALSFAILNPLMLLHFVGGAHNDALMIGFMAAAFAIGIPAKGLSLKFVALLLCAAAASIKLPAFAAVLTLGWIWGGAAVQSWTRRVVSGAIAGLTGLVLFELITAATGLGWGWIHALDVPGLAHPMVSPPNTLAMAIGGAFGVPYGFNEVTRAMANGISVILAVFFILRLGKSATAQQVMRGAGWALIGLGWLGPSVYAWYMGWGLALLAITGAAKMHKALIAAVIFLNFTILPGSYGFFDQWTDWRRTVLAFLMCGVYSWAIFSILRINGITRQSIKADVRRGWDASGLERRISDRRQNGSRRQVYGSGSQGTLES